MRARPANRLPLRFFAVTLVGGVLAAPSFAQSDRYGAGGSAPNGSGSSTFDFDQMFNDDNKPSGGSSYRSAGSPSAGAKPTTPSDLKTLIDTPPAPGAAASSNRLRSIDTQPSTARTTAAPRTTAAADPYSRSSAASRPPSASSTTRSSTARAPATAGVTGGRDYRQPASPSRSATSTYAQPDSRFDRSANASAGSSRSGAANSAAAQREEQTRAILEDMLARPASSRLGGSPMRLASVVATGGTRELQAQLVDTYWELTASTIDYYLSLAEADELSRLRQRAPTYGTALNQVQVALDARIDTSLSAARAAQLRLARLMGTGARPLPADTPFCGPYATRYETIFPGNGPEEAQLLNQLLPMRLGELHDAVDAIAESQEWIKKVESDRGSVQGMVNALKLLALNRRAFVQIACDYNQQVNRFAQLASPGAVDTGRLVAMLIRTPNAGSLASTPPVGRSDSANLDFRSGGSTPRR